MKLSGLLRPIGLLVSVAALTAGVSAAQANYESTVLANGPVGYWRFNETVQPPPADAAVNSGSLGVSATGYYQGTAMHPVQGALVASQDSAAMYDGVSGTVTAVAYHPAMNPGNAFTVEAWLNPAVDHAPGSGTVTAPISAGHLADPRSGWLIYQSETNWNFRMYNQNGLNTSANISGGAAPAAGTWQHVVAVYDGAKAYLYVNGQLGASADVPSYVPGTDGPFFIGGRSDNNYWWSGMADEVAFYNQALTAAQIQSHYQNGINAAPSTPYDQLVKSAGPLAYYRLNEQTYTAPTTFPVAKNVGTAGAAGDGSYYSGLQVGVASPEMEGFGADNKSAGFNGVIGHVATPLTLNDMPKFTVMGWLKRGAVKSGRGGYFGQNDLLEFGDVNSGTGMETYIAAYNGNMISSYPFADNEWGFVAVVGDGTKVVLYTNASPAVTRLGNAETYGSGVYNFNIGGGGVFNATGDYFLGQIDEVAMFDKALTPEQIMSVYLAAGVAPQITEQPKAPDRVLFEGNAAAIPVSAVGTAPIRYQWRKAQVDIAGMTTRELVFTSLKLSDAGDYDVVVSNDYGSVTSSIVTVAVSAADRIPPTLQYATGNRAFNRVRVWFSEPVDPATAQSLANYQLSGGLTIASATLSAPAGQSGDNIVILATSAQTAGQTYTLTVTGVKDQSSNLIAAGSTLQFTAWTLASGYLDFEHYDNLSGSSDTDLMNALTDSRVVAGTPTTVGHISGAFDTRRIFPDDTHENYFARISGYITPTESGDYTFFLRSDDASRLYLSADETLPNPAVDQPVAMEMDCCGAFMEPDTGDLATTPTPISLVAGRRYAVLALLKEGGGGDYLMVAWRKAGDTTPAANLPYLDGKYFGTFVDPNTDVTFTSQPTSQVGVLPSTGIEVFTHDFANNGGFTVTNTEPAPPGPWTHDATKGTWVAEGGSDDCTGPFNSQLTSPAYKLAQDGAVTLVFKHRYSFEAGLFDGGLVRVSVNGGAFTFVPAENFRANGYAPGALAGNGIGLGQRGFNGNSEGYTAGQFVTTTAFLGNFSKDDAIAVQFVGAWDECTVGSRPNWEIDEMHLELLPMTIQSFAKDNGNFTVENTTPAPPGPWTYVAASGVWSANGGESDCTGPYNTRLTSPAFVVPQSDEVTLSFTHRYSFESGMWDGGQVRVSVNGGPFTPVAAENFTANGFAPGKMEGTGELNGQPAFNGESVGYATNGFITSSVILGTFNQSDTIAIQFIGAWDECTTASVPGWQIKNVQLAFGKAARASTFQTVATATKLGQPAPFTYQWQRNDGNGFVNIPNANTASYQIYPTAADFEATFRVVVSVPGRSVYSEEVKLTLAATPVAKLTIVKEGISARIEYTGTLQSTADLDGTWTDVPQATSPYTVDPSSGTRFFRARN